VPTENLRFRENVLTFKVVEKQDDEEIKRLYNYNYPNMVKTLGDFQLNVNGGSFTDSEIIVLLGENGTGKTTLIRMLAGNLEPDGQGELIIRIYNLINLWRLFIPLTSIAEVPKLNISYKPQKISPKFQGTVRQLIMARIRDAAVHPQFNTDVLKPLQIDNIMDLEAKYSCF
jgi:ATP-binding cassette, sub-family E, member 1